MQIVLCFQGFPMFNPLRPSGKYTYHLLSQSVTLQFVFVFHMILSVKGNYFLNSVNQLISV
jgi:hypothetical protein